uniref:Uncharacterized protein n=1 Tax=Anopheles gambiae TaxID=7165 RepID=A0A453Z0Z1_ANOGA
MEEEFLILNLKPTTCRICATVSVEQYCIYETIYKDGTLSMHAMMEKLVPSVFNPEQMKVDEYMCWPRKVCEDCRAKVLEAYALYEQCMRSGDLLRECLSRKPGALVIENTYDDELKQDYAIETTVEETVSDFVDHDEPIVLDQSTESSAGTATGRRVRKQISKEPKSGKKQKPDLVEPRTPSPTDDFGCDSEEQDEKPLSSLVGSEKVARKSRSARNANAKRNSSATGKSNEQRTRGKKGPGRKPKQPKEESDNDTEEPKTKVDLYRCLLCDAPTYTSPKEHTDHLLKEHPDQIHCCKQCPKVFMTKAAFEHHQYCHATGRSFFCMFCDKGFQTEQLLKNHMRTHTHGTGFLCSHCGQEFSNRSNLRQHLIRHTGEKPWQCNLCPSRFSMKSYLDRHMHTHTKAKFFSCDTCGSQFSRHYSLVKHQLIHTGDRHFTCEVCSMRFTSSHHVKRHMLTHTGEKPFKCTYCERSFTQSNDMVKHMKTHVGENPYQCDRCEASFRLLTDLRNHYKDHYLPGGKDALSGEEDKGTIRFTSTNILKIRYEKERNSGRPVKQEVRAAGHNQTM